MSVMTEVVGHAKVARPAARYMRVCGTVHPTRHCVTTGDYVTLSLSIISRDTRMESHDKVASIKIVGTVMGSAVGWTEMYRARKIIQT